MVTQKVKLQTYILSICWFIRKFSFINIAPGFYSFDIFESIGDYDPNQYLMVVEPYKNAARFGYYHKPLEVASLGFKRFNYWNEMKKWGSKIYNNLLEISKQLNIKIIKGKGILKGEVVYKEENIIVLNHNKPLEVRLKNLALSLLNFDLKTVKIDLKKNNFRGLL